MQPSAVIIPSDRPATLGIARSLGQRGISVYAVDSDPRAIGLFSKYTVSCPLPDAGASEENRLQYLIDLGKKLGEPAVLFPVSDDDVILCSRERDVLHQYFRFVMPDHTTIMKLLTKNGLYQAAIDYGIPAPRTCVVKTQEDVITVSKTIDFPVILKPMISTAWLKPEIISMLRDDRLSSPPKVALCQNNDDLLRIYKEIAVFTDQLIVQEVITGEDKRLSYICFYVNRSSKPLALFAGQKLRVLPVGFGSATFVRSFRDSDLEEVCMKLIAASAYQGLGGIEFKKDPRDGLYKLIEFNVRFGLWDSLSTRCGIDIPFIAYCDALELPVEALYNYRQGVKWVDFQRDVRAFLIYRRRNKLSFVGWLKSLRGEKDWAIYSRDDWKPVLGAIWELIKNPFAAIMRKLHL